METNNKNTKDAILFVRCNDIEKADLEETVSQLGSEMTVSRFVREAVREKIAEIKQVAAEKAEPAAITA